MNPLDQLADIQLPNAVSYWPLAIGYWILLVIIIVAVIAGFIFSARRKRRLAARNKSLAALSSIDTDDEHALQQVHHVLKTAAQAYLPNRNILQMQGEQWRSVLRKLYKNKDANDIYDTLAALSMWQYDQRISLSSNQQVKDAAKVWIEKALPPKKGALDV
jgi:hypothetical protein